MFRHDKRQTETTKRFNRLLLLFDEKQELELLPSSKSGPSFPRRKMRSLHLELISATYRMS